MTSCIGGRYDDSLSGMHCDFLPPYQQQQHHHHHQQNQHQQPQLHPGGGGGGMPKKSEPGEISGPRSKKMNKLQQQQQQQQQGMGPGGDADLMSSFGLKEDGSPLMKGGGPPGNGPGIKHEQDACSMNSNVPISGPGIDTMSKGGMPDGHPGDMGGGGVKMGQGLPGMMSSKPSNKLEYTQQQSQIFVFSTALANQGAEAVMSGRYASIIAYHCAHMQKQSRLGCGPMDDGGVGGGGGGGGGPMPAWMEPHGHGSPDPHHMRMGPGGGGPPVDGVKKSATIHHTPNPCLENDNSVPMFGNDHHGMRGMGPDGGGPMGKKPATIHHTPNPCMDQDGSLPMYPNDGGHPPPHPHMRMGGPGGPPDGMSKPSTIHHTPNSCMDGGPGPGGGPDSGEHPGGIHPPIKMENPSPGGPGPGPGNGGGGGGGGGGHSSSTIIDQMNSLVASLPLMKGGNVLSQSRAHPQPSLQGVKVPDENLTPQQRQHREQQLATIRQMQKMFFPEQRMMDPHGMGMRPQFRGGMPGPDFGGPPNRPLNPAFMNTPLGANGPMMPDGGPGPGMINEQIPPMQYNKPGGGGQGMMNPGMYMGGPGGGGPMGPMGGPMNRMYKPDHDPIFPPMNDMGGGYNNMGNHGPGMFNPGMQQRMGPGNMMPKMPDQQGGGIPHPHSPLVDPDDPLKSGGMMLPNAGPPQQQQLQQPGTPGSNGPGSNGTPNPNGTKPKEQSVSPEHHQQQQQQQQGGPGSQQGPLTPLTPQGGPLTPQTSMANT
ncbi:protein pygopus-like [Culex pipiens pallens]|uniref:protein pygopus-like n=1 Tax=Culex pipiens pallens TaxID=42434 RepID=UPI001953191C|nr:protein pygopus-like [Culex pipiens pallens]